MMQQNMILELIRAAGVTGGRRFTEVREEIDTILRSHMINLKGATNGR